MIFEVEPLSEAGDTRELLTRLKAILFDGVATSAGDDDIFEEGDTFEAVCD